MNLSFLVVMTVLTLVSTRKLVSAQFREPSPETANWTSCQEFVNNTNLDTDKLLNIDWKIFFFWSPEIETSYDIRFSRPSSVLIDRFQVEMDKDLDPPANWSNAELFMESSIEFSALFLRTPTPGIYRIIPTTAFEYQVQTPLLLFGLKLVEPYLGISNCRYRICYALAPADKMPYHYELEKAASTLKFYNPYNRTHIALPPSRATEIPNVAAANLPDVEEDEDLEIEKDLSKVDFF